MQVEIYPKVEGVVEEFSLGEDDLGLENRRRRRGVGFTVNEVLVMVQTGSQEQATLGGTVVTGNPGPLGTTMGQGRAVGLGSGQLKVAHVEFEQFTNPFYLEEAEVGGG